MSHDQELENLREYCGELEEDCYEEVEKDYLPIPETDEERRCSLLRTGRES